MFERALFETYDPSYWQEKGIVLPPPKPERIGARRSAKYALVGMAVAAVTFAATSSLVAIAPSHVATVTEVELRSANSSNPNKNDIVPAGYWDELAKAFDQSTVLEETVTDRSKPLI